MSILKKNSRTRVYSINGHRTMVNWKALPAGKFQGDETVCKEKPVQKATLAGHERGERVRKSWGRGSRHIDRDFTAGRFYADTIRDDD